jgi:2-methylcitrate dehydratase PrpD
MPFGAAIALLHRNAGLDQFTDENFRSAQIREFMGKVVLTRDPRIEKDFPAEWPAIVQIHLNDGKQFEKNIRFPKGDPENPLSWQELSAKFQSLAGRVFPKSRCDQIVSSVKELNPSTELCTIWKLAAGSASRSRPAN